MDQTLSITKMLSDIIQSSKPVYTADRHLNGERDALLQNMPFAHGYVLHTAKQMSFFLKYLYLITLTMAFIVYQSTDS